MQSDEKECSFLSKIIIAKSEIDFVPIEYIFRRKKHPNLCFSYFCRLGTLENTRKGCDVNKQDLEKRDLDSK